MWGMIIGWERPLQPGDEDLLLTVEDLHVDGQVDIEPDSVRTWRTQFIDLSVQLDYEFESDDVYMSSTINREMSSRPCSPATRCSSASSLASVVGA